jgi:hypothetical protein
LNGINAPATPSGANIPGKDGNVGNVSTTADGDEHQFWHEATVCGKRTKELSPAECTITLKLSEGQAHGERKMRQ